MNHHLHDDRSGRGEGSRCAGCVGNSLYSWLVKWKENEMLFALTNTFTHRLMEKVVFGSISASGNDHASNLPRCALSSLRRLFRFSTILHP